MLAGARTCAGPLGDSRESHVTRALAEALGEQSGAERETRRAPHRGPPPPPPNRGGTPVPRSSRVSPRVHAVPRGSRARARRPGHKVEELLHILTHAILTPLRNNASDPDSVQRMESCREEETRRDADEGLESASPSPADRPGQNGHTKEDREDRGKREDKADVADLSSINTIMSTVMSAAHLDRAAPSTPDTDAKAQARAAARSATGKRTQVPNQVGTAIFSVRVLDLQTPDVCS
ncbi:hypothetical protein GN956_G14643 [Arapaima gigas]